MSKKKIAVYTAITGGYDKLKEPRFVSKKFDYICFTDDENMKSNIWDIRKMNYSCDNLSRMVRRYKILPHLYLPEYTYSIWVDGSLLIIGNLRELLNKEIGNAKMAFFKHSARNCIYDEAKVCIKHKRDDRKIISKQIKKYKLEGYPKNQGLIEAGAIFRKHNENEVIDLMEMWWNEVSQFSIRDQLSFNYVAWKNKAVYKLIEKNIFSNEYFIYVPHNYIYKFQ